MATGRFINLMLLLREIMKGGNVMLLKSQITHWILLPVPDPLLRIPFL